MADMVQFDLVCPERSLASGLASEVLIPGSEGELTAGPGHEPMLTTLRPGFLRAELEGGAQDFVVTHGFVEISAQSVSVIAERAFAAADVARPDLEAILEEARDRMEQAAEDEERHGLERFVADLVHLIDRMD
ncbi:ATP synthase F1 subunit epsilon [Donghicola tyrosinivorans]|jgi:F-type H+-transporting ATPase subunit epsilon|uniref:ATP synthase epsilon chain n=1 Tax=Donghicola tyrosinivorans TaxID=1652492 RepID=A0A2T0X0E5_9RHOB|nr:ATP synthase F1 subunit epsilon [Donghicola tyrosinivorans]PRY92418.1 F-type H+-transporting ATPase subunit epsilon [Donghicola tyrosinivorans]